MYKIALGAGHVLNTAGKRLPIELDPNQTREWWLNDRICDKVEKKLGSYDGYALVRVDDTNGLVPHPDGLAGRCAIANDFGADVFVAVHHNAAGRIFSGGGIVVYRDPLANDKATVSLQEEMYAALIAHTGLKGNRADPMAESALYVLRNTKMPAVLLELGFMDSTVDAPIILTEEYAEQCADAIVEVLVKRGGLTKKETAEPAPAPKDSEWDTFNLLMSRYLYEQKAASPSNWSEEARNWATQSGLILGTGDAFEWKRPVTREELAVILRRYDQNK